MSETEKGFCGDGILWCLDRTTGQMTISGSGPMADYESEKEVPWYSLKDEITEVSILDGVTTVGDYAFRTSTHLKKFHLSASVEIIGTYAFGDCGAIEEALFPEGVRVIGAKAFSADARMKTVRIPLSLKAVDMKAFDHAGIETVDYAGTRQAFKEIRVSPTALGNRFLLNADIHFEGKQEKEPIPEKSSGAAAGRVRGDNIPVYEIAREIIRRGGDGRLHILAVDLSWPGLPQKPGDCAFIVFPDGQVMMIDAGYHACEERVLKAMQSLGLTSLDYFAVSHAHVDHVGNAMAVVKYIYGHGGSIGSYLYTGFRFRDLEPALCEELKRHGVKMDNHLAAGDTRQIGDVQLDILSPTKEEIRAADQLPPEDINSISMAMKFTFGDASYLTSGDLYRVDERRVAGIYKDKVKSTVMKANHHGVFTSNSIEWLRAVSPEVMLVEGDDIGGTVLSETAARMGIEYYSAGLDGSVLISLSREGDVEVKAAYGRTFCRKKNG